MDETHLGRMLPGLQGFCLWASHPRKSAKYMEVYQTKNLGSLSGTKFGRYMRITYDQTVDAAKIYLVEIESGASVTQKCLSLENGEIILDFDKDGYLLGIEILGADSILKPELRIASELR